MALFARGSDAVCVRTVNSRTVRTSRVRCIFVRRTVWRWVFFFFYSSCLLRNNNKKKNTSRTVRVEAAVRIGSRRRYIKRRPKPNTFVFFPINPFTGYERYANNNVNCRENSAKTAFGNTVFNLRDCVTFRFTSEDYPGPTRVREEE